MKILSDKLLDDFAKSYLLKLAQDAEAADPSLAIKLVNNLLREFSGEPESLDIQSSNDNTTLKVQNLQNIDNFLKFLSDNKITINGNRVVLNGAEYNAIQPPPKEYYPVSAKVGRESDTTQKPDSNRKWNVTDYFTNTSLLGEYVKYLQAKAVAGKKAKDPEADVFLVMIGKLIDQINQHIDTNKSLGLERAQEKSTPEKPAKLNEASDEDVIANIEKTFDFKTPINQIGNIALKVKDIKSREVLNSWLSQGNKAIVVMYDDKGASTQVYWDAPNADKCIIMQILFNKAKYLYDKAKDQEQSKLYGYFLNQIKTLASQYDYNGKACQLLGAGQSIEQLVNPSAPGTQKPEEKLAPGTISKQQLTLLGDISDYFPLERDSIVFSDILTFMSKANSLFSGMAASKDYSILEQNLSTAINNAKKYLQPSYTASALNIDVSPSLVMSHWLNKPTADAPARNYMSLINELISVVENTGKMLTLISIAFRTQLTDPRYSSVKEALRIQGNDYNQNMSYLATLKNASPKVVSR